MLCIFEGYRENPYKDTGGIWTIGYGATYDKNGNKVTKNTLKMSKNDARELLNKNVMDVSSFVYKKVKKALLQNQFDACVLLTYNIGVGNFQKSKLLKNLNSSTPVIPDNFLSWNKDSTGKIIPGLVSRRKKEYALFLEQ